MLAEFLGAVINNKNRFLVETLELNSNMYVRFPRVETVNAIAKKEEILIYGIKKKFNLEVSVNECIYQEDFMDGSDVISYAYFSSCIVNGIIPDNMIWIDKCDLVRANFTLGDDIALAYITCVSKAKEEVVSASCKYIKDINGIKKTITQGDAI